MNGVHDLGGMHGFGPIVREANEPVFHAPWEGRLYGISRAALRQRLYNLDEFRYAIERMNPAHYLAASYYEKWITGIERLLIEKGVLTQAQVDTYANRLLADPNAALPEFHDAALTERLTQRSAPPKLDPAAIMPRFAVGDAVRARNVHPVGHTRLPRFVRGHRGVVARVQGAMALPDAAARGDGEVMEALYVVRFSGPELWGADAEPNSNLLIDMFDSYLDPA